jgi:pimeloyl-ACP methyl ester carboxylesterase
MKMAQKSRMWWLKGAAILGIAGIALALVGCVTQQRFDQTVRSRFPAPGAMVDVGSHALQLHCTGKGIPVVVLEAGLTGWSQDWSHVQPLLAKRTTVCSYDRAGYGWSDEPPAPQEIEDNVEDLRRALMAAGHRPQWVLVGHSLGGLHAQAFARLHPEEVSAVVLVDSLETGLMTSMAAEDEQQYNRNIERLAGSSVWLSRIGMTRLLGVPVTLIADRHPTDAERLTAKALGMRTSAFRTFRDEVYRVPEWLDHVASLPPYPDVPTTVLSTNALADFPPGFEAEQMRRYWIASQVRLAQETRGRHRIIPDTGHFLHIEHAETVTEAALQSIASTAN